jgi:translation initiation factor 3 subunit A
MTEKQKQRERELEEKERLRKEALIKEEPRVSKPIPNKFVPRPLRETAESAGAEADNDRWRRGDRQTHVDGRREADVPARDKYAPPSRKYEPPTQGKYEPPTRQTQGKYEPPVSGRRDNYEPPRGRDAQPPMGRYGQRPKYGGFGNNRDERDRWGAAPDRDEDRSGGADNWRRHSKAGK